MHDTSRYDAAALLPSYASDTSGVCSACYELEGMTVVHDASGCNSTYSTFDEPRWYAQESLIFISALTEMDAILGNETKLIDDCVNAAKTLAPKFLTLCQSPMPFLLGTDLAAIGRELEERLGIPVLSIKTNGMRSYIAGASQAWQKIVERFCKEPRHPKGKRSVNILGASPLDLNSATYNALRAWLVANDFTPASSLALATNLSAVEELPAADVNLVVSSAALACAHDLERRFGQPYVVGLPIGHMATLLNERLSEALRTKKSVALCHEGRAQGSAQAQCTVIGESVFAASMALALEASGHPCRIYCPLEESETVLGPGDFGGREDEALAEELCATSALVVADPLYKVLCPPTIAFLPTPHQAFSGRIFANQEQDFITNAPLLHGAPHA